MKNHLGIKAVILISLGMFGWSGCLADPPSIGKYEVYAATGGHMQVGDVFELSIVSETEFRLIPKSEKNNLKGRWPASVQHIELRLGDGKNPDDLCGFPVFDNYDHQGNRFGHDMEHGVLIKRLGPSDENKELEVQIIWSALPLKGNSSKAKCRDLEERFHGGMAHAKG